MKDGIVLSMVSQSEAQCQRKENRSHNQRRKEFTKSSGQSSVVFLPSTLVTFTVIVNTCRNQLHKGLRSLFRSISLKPKVVSSLSHPP